MSWMAAVKDILAESDSDYDDVEMVTKEDEVDCCYGLEVVGISKPQILDILNGHCGYIEVNGGEYAILITLKGENNETN